MMGVYFILSKWIEFYSGTYRVLLEPRLLVCDHLVILQQGDINACHPYIHSTVLRAYTNQ